jgi:hypothetical protein
MFDVLMRIAKIYQSDPAESPSQASALPPASTGKTKKATPAQAFWRAVARMQRMAIQPLDLLPPVDVTFRDYAIAVCRAEQLANPTDPRGYRDMLIDVFRKRGIRRARSRHREAGGVPRGRRGGAPPDADP